MSTDAQDRREQDPLSKYELFVVGRYVLTDGDSYYLPEQRWQFLSSLVEPFRKGTYVGYVCDLPESGAYVELDDEFDVVPNEVWNSDASLVRRLASVRGDAKAIIGEGTVTFSYFPGTYSFLVAPLAMRRGDVNVAYFGKAAGVSAEGLSNGPLLTKLQRELYPRAEQYVVERADAVFVRDPRVIREGSDTDIAISKPVSEFSPTIDVSSDTQDIDEPVELLYVGSFRPTKGHEYLVDALDHLNASSGREYRLRFVGDGTTMERIEDQVNRAGLSEVVDFRGYVADEEALRSEYENADVFVLPSETEGFPRVLNEATAMGVPVVATRVGGIPLLFEDRTHAVLVEPKNPSALATGIETVVEDASLRQSLVQHGVEFARAHSGDPVEQHLNAIRRCLR